MMNHTIFDETHYLPFGLSNLPEGPWLILAPHCDDESFGMGGCLLLAQKAKIPVYIVIMTDGSLGGDTSTRNEESLAVAQKIGAQTLLFFQEKDRELIPNQVLINKVTELIISNKIKHLFFPHPMEAHPDHRATAIIGWEALRKCKFSAKGYSYEISSQGLVSRAIDITSVADEKRSLLSLYKSQIALNNYIDVVMALNKTRTWSLPEETLYAEAFYAWESEDKSLGETFLLKLKQLTGCKALHCLDIKGTRWLKNLLYR